MVGRRRTEGNEEDVEASSPFDRHGNVRLIANKLDISDKGEYHILLH